MHITEFSSLRGEIRIWFIKDDKEVPLSSCEDPVAAVALGEAEPFRHLLREFTINGVTIPSLSMGVGQQHVEFDFRRGRE